MARVSDEEVVAFLRAGHTQAETADHFEINERTVRKKLKNVEAQEAQAEAEAEEARRAADKARKAAEEFEAKRRARLKQLPPGVPEPEWVVFDENGEEDWQPWIDSYLRRHPALQPVKEPDEATPVEAQISILDMRWWWHAQSRAWARCQRVYVNASHRRAYRRQQQHYRSGAWRVQEQHWDGLWENMGLVVLLGAAITVLIMNLQ